ATASPEETRVVPGEILVRFEDGIGVAERAEIRQRAGVVAKRNLLLPSLQLVRIDPQTSASAALTRLNRDRRIRYAEPNSVYSLQRTPNDPLTGRQWGLENTGQPFGGIPGVAGADISAAPAWDVATGDAKVKIAVVDTGIDYFHPDLAANMWRNPGEVGNAREANGVDDDGNGFVDDVHGWDFVAADNRPSDSHGHGSGVAGIIGAVTDDNLGTAGINWKASLIALKACGLVGPHNGCPLDALLDAFTYAGRMGADVVNLSLSGAGYSQAGHDVMALYPSTLFVAAAGNSGADLDNDDRWPCEIELVNVLCVAATDHRDELVSLSAHAWGSNYGARSVDLGAPGANILSTALHNREFFGDRFTTASLWDYAEAADPPDPSRWRRTVSQHTYGVGPLIKDSPEGRYPNSADTRVTLTDPINLVNRHGCVVKLWAGLETEVAKDYLRVEAAVHRDGQYHELGRWSGSTNGQLSTFEAPLGDFDGQSAVYLRLRLTSDEVNTYDGAYVTEVVVRCSYASLAGTSFATPQVAGAAALVKSHVPGLSVSRLRERLLRTVDPLPSLTDKTVSGGRLNVSRALTADLDSPATKITAGPPAVSNSSEASFAFSASEEGSRFECRLDAASFAACDPPARYEQLDDGKHEFEVRAIDTAGNVGSVAKTAWSIDTSPPPVTIANGPATSTTSRETTLTFTSPEQVDVVECRLDEAPFAACTSPVSFDDLALGEHVFAVRARDAAGNWTSPPAAHSWRIVEPSGDAPGSETPSSPSTIVGAPRAPDLGDPRPVSWALVRTHRPRLSLRIPLQRISRVLRLGLASVGIVEADCPCRLSLRFHLDRSTVRGGSATRVARSRGRLALIVRLTRQGQMQVRRTSRVRGSLQVTVVDRHGSATTERVPVRLRR
ncbi:MAG TPA: S8 family serine peptidase, partial [Solirubrobacteraceae bacterium]|nr:S8 family serine peptidase [Solirubrobacteraceae bacterium]